MKTYISILFVLIISMPIPGQESGPTFNLDFEDNDNPTTLANEWIKWGDYHLSSDDKIVQSGKYSGIIESQEPKGNFGSFALRIPSKYLGKEITLEGYMKTENVEDGFAGLLLRLDGKSGSLGFNNMQNEDIQGSIEWKKYSITLAFSDKVEKIYVGGILTGKGKAWFDNFAVLIDGKSIQGMPLIEKPKSKAELDTEFNNGSLVELGELNSTDEERLFLLCKIWGLLKYYHPEVAKGNHNWDYELFRTLAHLKSTDFEAKLYEWIQSIGSIPAQNENEQKYNTTILAIDDSWIEEDKLLSQNTKNLLTQIRAYRNQDTHYYFSTTKGEGNAIFDNEMPYKQMEYTDDGIRLLTLFRFWNMVEYFFPHKTLMDENWDNVLKALIPKMANASDGISYKLATLQLVSKIQDTHTNIWMRDEDLTKFHGEFAAPLELKWIEDQWLVTKIYSMLDDPDSKIKIGDIITHVNDKPIAELVKEKIQYCPASNLSTQYRDVARRLLRTNESNITLTIESGHNVFIEEVSTILNEGINYWKNDIPSHKLLEGNIGYIYPGSLKKEEIHDIMKTFMSTKSLIIDLRCYPSDFLVYKLGKYLLPQKTEFAKFAMPIQNEPGRFYLIDPISNGSDNPEYYKGKIFILINEKTQSQAEYTTMALRNAPQATVIGSTTAGADGDVSRIILPGGIRTMFSGLGVYYPDGRETQRVGIIPDIELRPTIGGIRNGQDEVLEMAIRMSNE